MPRIVLGTALVLCLVGGPAAWAQFPDLVPSGDVRLPSADALVDEAKLLEKRLTAELSEREKQVAAETKRLEKEIEETELLNRETFVPEQLGEEIFDLGTANRLLKDLADELEIRREALSVCERALELAQRGPAPPIGSTSFEDYLALRERLQRSVDSARATSAEAQAAAKLAQDAFAPGEGRSLSQRARHQAGRLIEARADLTRARALADRIENRNLLQSAEAAAAHLRVAPEVLAEVRAEAKRSERELNLARQTWREERQRLQTARTGREVNPSRDEPGRVVEATSTLLRYKLDHTDLRLRAAELGHLINELKLLAAECLASERIDRERAEAAQEQLNTHINVLRQLRGTLHDTELEIAEKQKTLGNAIPKLGKILEEQHFILESQTALLDRLDGEVMRARAVASVLVDGLLARDRLPLWLSVPIALALVLLLIFLLQQGNRTIDAAFAPERGSLSQRFKLSAPDAAKLAALLTATWGVIALVFGVTLIVWGVFGFDLRTYGTSTVLEYPLLFLEERPITLASLVKLFVSVVLALALSRIARGYFGHRIFPFLGWDIGLTNALSTVLHYMVMLIGIFVGLRFVGIGLSSLALFASVLGIGIGFGLRNVAENFISGLIILAERPIKIGDFIELDGRIEGQVKRIRARSTTVATRDNVSIIIPNSEFVSTRVTNWSHGDSRVRVNIDVGVAHGSDTQLVRKLLLDAAGRHGLVLKEPSPEVYFEEIGDSALQFSLLFWIDEQFTRFRIASDLRFAVDAAFRRHNITVAYRQIDVHMHGPLPRASDTASGSTNPKPSEPDPSSKPT